MPRLTIQEAGEPVEYDILDPEVTIGRGAANAVQLTANGVSKHHAVVRRVRGRMKLVDLESLNGTAVNGRVLNQRWLMDGDVPGQAGNNHPTSIPTGVFETSNGYINIACAGQPMYLKLVDVFGDKDMLHEDFGEPKARSKNRDRLNALINTHTRKKSSEEWIEILNKAGVPCGEINAIDQVFASPQVKHLGLAADMNSYERGPTQVVAQPMILSRTNSSVKHPPPKLSQHTDDILAAAGYSPDEIAKFRSGGVI